MTRQAKALLKFIEAISEKTLRSTVALTAARGRGKSAALGLAIASAVAFRCGAKDAFTLLQQTMQDISELYTGFQSLWNSVHEHSIVYKQIHIFRKVVLHH